jgi:hypothetical protein
VVPGVSDEERNRYGVLLDHAAQRGLLSPAEYQVRLAELARATSVDVLRRIVTELPAFGLSGSPGAASAGGRSSRSVRPTRSTPPPVVPAPGGDPVDLDRALWSNLTPARQRRTSGNQWVILVVLIAVLLVAMVALALVAAHLAHTHHAATVGPGAAALSRLHL